MGRGSDAKPRLMDAVLELIWAGSYGTTTIDQICDKAGVKKGSFYYFFESKADLAKAALGAAWERRRVIMDGLFSSTVPPMERFKAFYNNLYENQKQLKERCGFVLGCPLFVLGSEVSTKEEGLREKVEEILGHWRQYLETAIRDAHAAGLVNAPDAALKARMLFAYQEGILTQARIQNDLEVLKDMERGTLDLLGCRKPFPVE